MNTRMNDPHPTTNVDNPEKALILTHPFQRFQVDEEEITDFLDNDHDYDAVFYVGQGNGRTPTPVSTHNPRENTRSRLPPGHSDGHYERGLEETRHGELTVQEAIRLLERYDEVAVGGGMEQHCVSNTVQSLKDVRENLEYVDGVDAEVYFEDEVTYP